MPRAPRISLAGLVYHIINRGNNRQAVFKDEEDFAAYLKTISRFKEKYSFITVVMQKRYYFSSRWFWTGMSGWGAGKIELETTYKVSGSGEEVAKIKTQGTVNTGFFGGSIESAYSRAVTEIVDYTVKEFGPR